MSFFLYNLRTALCQRLRTGKGWFILLLIPLLVIGADVFLPEEYDTASVQIGISLPKKGGEAFWERLKERGGSGFTFVLSDEEEIDRMVAAGQWDCGLILVEDFEERLRQADTDRIFTLRISPGSTVYPLVRETVAACVAELISPGIAADYLKKSGIVSDENALAELYPRLEQILPDSDRVMVLMTTADGTPLDTLELAGRGVKNLIRWMVSGILLAWLLLSVADLGNRSEAGAVKRLCTVQPFTLVMASFAGADTALAAISGVAAMLYLGDGAAGCAAVVAYAVFWGTMSVLLAHFRSVWTAVPVWMPFVLVASLLGSSALVDASLILPLPGGSALSWFPAALFLQACHGSVRAVICLLAMTGTGLVCSFLVDQISKQYNCGLRPVL